MQSLDLSFLLDGKRTGKMSTTSEVKYSINYINCIIHCMFDYSELIGMHIFHFFYVSQVEVRRNECSTIANL